MALWQPGGLSLHHELMIYGYGPNTSEDRRIGVVIRYISPHVQKPNNACDYSVPLRSKCDTENFNRCAPTKVLFHSNNIIQYKKIREDQVKIIMARARDKTAMYS